MATRADLVKFLSDFNGVASADIAPHVYDVTDLDVARHLFRVAAGLDSLVVGEPQVLGQVKEAHTAATDAHTPARSSTGCSIPRSPSASACGPRPVSDPAPCR